MKNTVQVASKKYQTKKWVALLLLVPTFLAIILLFTFRGMNTHNYNGNVKEVSGTVMSIDIDEDDNSINLTLSNNVAYNANPIRTRCPDFDLDTLLGKEVTLFLPESQVGEGNIPTWILGVKQGDVMLVDYNEVIAAGRAENNLGMTITGALAGVFGAISIGLFASLKLRPDKGKSVNFYEIYAEIVSTRQHDCPEYKHLTAITVLYLVLTVLLIGLPLGIIETLTDNVATQISVGVSLCVVFLGVSVGFIVYAFKLAKKERDFYAENFPFDMDDVSHLHAYGSKQQKQREELQRQLREEREKYPHRYYDAGNGCRVDFTQDGVEILDDEASFSTPGADFVFGEGAETEQVERVICKLTYAQLNFEALPYYRKKDHPLTVIIKSRIADSSGLPEDIEADLHLALDVNLLATLQRFGVEVENLQYILDNKAQLISENCTVRKKRK